MESSNLPQFMLFIAYGLGFVVVNPLSDNAVEAFEARD